MKKEYLEVGKIVSTRGLNGELKVESWCDRPEVMCGIERLYLDYNKDSIKVNSLRVHKNMVLLKVDGVDNVESADKLRGKIIYAHREDIPKEDGSYFIQDLLDMDVVDVDKGIKYGKIKEVFSTGANDVYIIEGYDGKLYYMPAIPDVVINIDLQKNEILVRPIEGIFENDD